MAGAVEMYRRSVEGFGQRVVAIGPDDWDRPTPCSDWMVRDLVRHLVYEELWAPPLFEGQTIADVGDRFEGDIQSETQARRVTAPVSGGAEALEAALGRLRSAGVDIVEIGLRRPTLDDVFLALTGRVSEPSAGEEAAAIREEEPVR